VGLPGRPAGNADNLRAGAGAWDHLAWQVWHLNRPVEKRVGALFEGWAGPAADGYRERWNEVRRGLAELDHRLHTVADRLRVLAGHVEDAQTQYDHLLGAAGIATVAGLGLAVFTLGASEVAAAEADGAVAASIAGTVAEYELVSARMAALIDDAAQLLDRLAARFVVNFVVSGPRLAFGPAGGAATGVGVALAAGARDPADLAASGLLGAVESLGGGPRDTRADTSAPGITSDEPMTVERGLEIRFSTRAEARQALTGTLRAAANRFFRDATSKSRDFRLVQMSDGGHWFQFFTPARNRGYGKLYVQKVDEMGRVVTEYKDTLGPSGLIERKWIREER